MGGIAFFSPPLENLHCFSRRGGVFGGGLHYGLSFLASVDISDVWEHTLLSLFSLGSPGSRSATLVPKTIASYYTNTVWHVRARVCVCVCVCVCVYVCSGVFVLWTFHLLCLSVEF